MIDGEIQITEKANKYTRKEETMEKVVELSQ